MVNNPQNVDVDVDDLVIGKCKQMSILAIMIFRDFDHVYFNSLSNFNYKNVVELLFMIKIPLSVNQTTMSSVWFVERKRMV